MQNYLLVVDKISTYVGKASAWLIVVLTLLVCYDVTNRYVLNSPSPWIFDVSTMMYGALFMLAGAYTLSQDAHVRGDFLYGSMKPRTQAAFDLVLYIVFFLPGIAALCYAGWDFAGTSWRIQEHSSLSANGPPIYHFKTLIPIAGILIMIQGLAEIARCVVCLRTGEWPQRLKDAEEIDVIEQQLAGSTYVDEAARREVIEKAVAIDEAARHRSEATHHHIEADKK